MKGAWGLHDPVWQFYVIDDFGTMRRVVWRYLLAVPQAPEYTWIVKNTA